MTQAKSHKCPSCKKPTDDRFRPFCSKRCKDIDLAHWFSGRYFIPAREGDEKIGEEDKPNIEKNGLSFSAV